MFDTIAQYTSYDEKRMCFRCIFRTIHHIDKAVHTQTPLRLIRMNHSMMADIQKAKKLHQFAISQSARRIQRRTLKYILRPHGHMYMRSISQLGMVE